MSRKQVPEDIGFLHSLVLLIESFHVTFAIFDINYEHMSVRLNRKLACSLINPKVTSCDGLSEILVDLVHVLAKSLLSLFVLLPMVDQIYHHFKAYPAEAVVVIVKPIPS